MVTGKRKDRSHETTIPPRTSTSSDHRSNTPSTTSKSIDNRPDENDDEEDDDHQTEQDNTKTGQGSRVRQTSSKRSQEEAISEWYGLVRAEREKIRNDDLSALRTAAENAKGGSANKLRRILNDPAEKMRLPPNAACTACSESPIYAEHCWVVIQPEASRVKRACINCFGRGCSFTNTNEEYGQELLVEVLDRMEKS